MEYPQIDSLFFEEIELHKKYISGAYLLTDNDIIQFARRWDPMPFHLDHESAKESMFGGLIASGLHQLVICHRLLVDAIPKGAFLAGLGMDQFRLHAPARPGDTLTAEVEIVSKRDSESIPGAGVIQTLFRLMNQQGEVTLSYIATALVKKHPPGA